MDALLSDETAAQREVDLLRYEVKEIDSVRPIPGEYAILTENLKRMQHSERIFERLTEAYEALSAESPSAIDAAGRARLAVADISDIAEDYNALSQSLSDCYFELEEIATALHGMLDGIDHSARSIDETIARIDQLERLINKYAKNAGRGIDDPLESVLAYRDSAVKRLDNIESLDSRKAELTTALKKAQDELLHESCILSRLRKKAAEALDVRVNAELLALNFSNAQFQAVFQNDPDEPESAMLSENGIDQMEFLLSANKGQPLLPVAKVASGGEMSRIMLALKAVVGAFDRIPTMIFDEIDTGISGVTASIVGEKLCEIAKDRQIICITHLPQIAACSDHHFVIEKNSDESATYTTIREVAGEDRVSDIARMLGGRTITPATIAGAEELIALSRS
jgi:DNA repair protein RecN (Recombination protein N)